jgi:outer membrane protein OmpA-like peptidoglycan-associated protein
MIYAMPSMLKPYLERKIAEAIGGEARIGAIEVMPFKLAFITHDFSAASNTVEFAWDSLYIDAQLRSIFTQSIYLDEFRIHNPSFKLVLEQGEGNFSAMKLAEEVFLPHLNAPMYIKRLIIQNGALELFDKRTEIEKRFSLATISFSLENFSTQYSAGKGNSYNLQFTSLNGGFFSWNGNLHLAPFYSEGEMEIRGLDITQLRDFYQEHLPFKLQSGKLDLRTRYKAVEKPELGFVLENAKLILNKASLLADSSNLSAEIASVQMDSLRVSTLDGTFFTSKFMLDSANVHYVLHKIPELPSSKLFEKFVNLPHWQIKIDSMQARQAQIKIIDSAASHASEHTLNATQLLLTNITNNASDSVRIAGNAILNSGELDLQGAVNLFPLRVFANLNISEFPLASLQNYLSEETWLNLRQGQATAKLSARLRPAADSLQKDTLLFTGDAEIDSLRLQAKNNQEFIRAQRIIITELNLALAPKPSWQAVSVNLQAPTMYLIWFADSTANYSQIKKHQEKPEKNDGIPFIINRVNFSRGSLHLTDKSPATLFSYYIASAQGSLRNLSNQKRDANLSVYGKMGGYAPFSLNGSINLSKKHPELNIAMKCANQDLVAFSPYSGRYAGYSIAKGQMAFEADYAIKNNKMQGNNHIVIQHLTFGEAVESPDATNLPVRLATSLLSDKDGVIDLDVAVTGDLDDPEFSIASLIWKVIKNLLGKAAAAPLKSLMALIGSDADPETIVFAPGSAQIGKSQEELLESLSQALMQRPHLQLDVYGNADSAQDGDSLTSNDLRNLAYARAQSIKTRLVNINASLGKRIFVVNNSDLSGLAANLKIRE